jgi:hypothetical protein
VSVQNLDRYLAAQLLVMGTVNHSHAALADFLDDAIAFWQGFRKHRP